MQWNDGDAILHVVDTATRFSATTFLDRNGRNYSQSVKGAWTASIECWSSLCTGFPNRLRTDAGSIFTTRRWQNLTESAGISVRVSGVEAHNSLGIGGKLHDPLRQIYRKIKYDFPGISKDIMLRLATKCKNNTMGENGFIPSLLVCLASSFASLL